MKPHSIETREESRSPKMLVLGYGNPGRLDDGIGPALVAALEPLALQGLRVESSYQLAVEDAVSVAGFEVVVFADASVDALPPFELATVRPRADGSAFTTHSVAPEAILGLAHDLYGARTVGYTLAIRGYQFGDFGEGLSPKAQANLEAALVFLRKASNRDRLRTPLAACSTPT